VAEEEEKLVEMMVAQNKKLDTVNFIESVKKYPEIFNTTHPGFKQQDDKNGAWHKIADEFNTDRKLTNHYYEIQNINFTLFFSYLFVCITYSLANLCKKKFRTLRERYTRELRRSYLEPGTPIKFEYFKQLNFLSPYIKFRSIMFETSEGKTVVTKREDLSMDKSDITTEIKILESESYYEDENDQQSYVQENPGTSSIIYETSTGVDHHHHIQEEYTDQQSVHLNDRHSDDEMLTTTSSSKGKDRKRKNSWNELVDDDDGGNKYFAMSVACSLKRLTTLNNLKAKVEIYQILEKYATKENE